MTVVREDLIPSWRELRSSLPGPDRLGPRQRELVTLLSQYAAGQEELWTLIADGAPPNAIEARTEEVLRLRGLLDAHVIRR